MFLEKSKTKIQYAKKSKVTVVLAHFIVFVYPPNARKPEQWNQKKFVCVSVCVYRIPLMSNGSVSTFPRQ
jgi:hypothetical protein